MKDEEFYKLKTEAIDLYRKMIKSDSTEERYTHSRKLLVNIINIIDEKFGNSNFAILKQEKEETLKEFSNYIKNPTKSNADMIKIRIVILYDQNLK